MLTADRPPELREVGAGQTIDQLKLYGDAAKWFFEVGTHARDARAAALDAPARLPRLLRRRVSGRPGAVHLNFALREPLVLDAAAARRPTTTPLRPRRGRSAPAAAHRARASASARVIVAGRHERDDGLAAALPRRGGRRSARRCWPTRSPARGAAPRPSPTTTRCCATRPSPPPTAPTPSSASATCRPPSRCASGWPALDGARQVAFDPEGAWQDPAAVVGEVLDADPAALGAGRSPAPPRASAWLDAWRGADDAAAEAIAADARRRDLASRPWRARSAALPSEVTVFTASSMPVRDVESFWPVRDAPPRVLAHRGANGIDGTLAAAFGAAAAGAGASSSTSATSPSPTTSARCSAPRA